ncbi:MAG: hypothetical protein ACK5IP_11385 [Paracoccus sp. (in: a-proteobacteria)]
MTRLALALLLLLAAPLAAQEPTVPLVETELDQTEAVPGQPVTLRLTVLVPTWMPSPPELPDFETPNLRVRVPPRGSTAISRQIGGETWSGVSRRYLLTPMVPGRIALPPQEIALTYIGPDGTTPVSATLQTGPITVTGIVPEGAEGLDPFIAAEALDLTQDLSGPTTDLAPGDSVTRTLTATIEGASPIVLPPLLPQLQLPVIRVYPASPQVVEDSDGDRLSGTRVESQTWMAIGGGEGSAAPVSIDWFNLKTGKVETAGVPGVEIAVTGPPPRRGTPRAPLDWRLILAVVAALMVAAAVLRRVGPRVARARRAARSARLEGEAHARQMLLRAIARQNYPATAHWLAEWQGRLPRPGPVAMREIPDRMARVGATIYRDAPDAAGSSPQEAWRDLAAAIRRTTAGKERAAAALPGLNPSREGRA